MGVVTLIRYVRIGPRASRSRHGAIARLGLAPNCPYGSRQPTGGGSSSSFERSDEIPDSGLANSSRATPPHYPGSRRCCCPLRAANLIAHLQHRRTDREQQNDENFFHLPVT